MMAQHQMTEGDQTDNNNLLWGIQNGDLDEVKGIVEQDSKKLGVQLKGRYPLHHAADYGQKEVIQYLVEMGADVNQTDSHGITPLLAAIYEGHTECIKLLLAKGAKKTGTDPNGSSYIDVAESEEIKALLK